MVNARHPQALQTHFGALHRSSDPSTASSACIKPAGSVEYSIADRVSAPPLTSDATSGWLLHQVSAQDHLQMPAFANFSGGLPEYCPICQLPISNGIEDGIACGCFDDPISYTDCAADVGLE